MIGMITVKETGKIESPCSVASDNESRHIYVAMNQRVASNASVTQPVVDICCA